VYFFKGGLSKAFLEFMIWRYSLYDFFLTYNLRIILDGQVWHFEFWSLLFVCSQVDRFWVQRSGLKALNSLYQNNPGFMVFIKQFYPVGYVAYSRS
jgi:hypothetical protein